MKAGNNSRTIALSRELWEEEYPEDKEKFTDYYYEWIAKQNHIYLKEKDGKAVAMMHRNPYRIMAAGKCVQASRLAGIMIASVDSYWNKKYLSKLMREVLADSYEEGEPFVFVRPDREEIEDFQNAGFWTVQDQRGSRMDNVYWPYVDQEVRQEMAHTLQELTCVRAKYEDLPELTEFSGRVLREHCAVYAERTVEYFQRVWEEQKAVGGEILLLRKNGGLTGYCLVNRENGSVLTRELAVSPADPLLYAQAINRITEYYREELPIYLCGLLPDAQVTGMDSSYFLRWPLTMVRITNLYSMAKLLRAEKETEALLEIEDDLIPQNNGCFRLILGPEGGELVPIKKEQASKEFLSLTTYQLAADIFSTQWKKDLPEEMQLLRPVYLNELA